MKRETLFLFQNGKFRQALSVKNSESFCKTTFKKLFYVYNFSFTIHFHYCCGIKKKYGV